MELNIKKSVLIAATLPLWPFSEYYDKFSTKMQNLLLAFLCHIVTKPLITTLLVLFATCLLSAAVIPSLLIFTLVFVGITTIVMVEGLAILIIAITLFWGVITIVLLLSIIVNTKYF